MTADRDERLDEIIAGYLHQRETGDPVDAEQWVTAHPDFADDLREFLADDRQFGILARPLAEPVISRQPVPERVRYFGDYELLEEVARGGMGIVYRARQTSLNRIVAIKMILAGHLASEIDAKRFQVEAEAAANLRHANIVAVHEVGRHNGQSYFSMDYVDGKNLSEITRQNLLPVNQAAEYALQIARAVAYAHGEGTLHRDLKPSNVLIDANGDVRITDFGLAARVEGDSGLTKTDQVLGTPGYMPPEQARNQRGLIGPASDIYSLGATLYDLLTGRPPFRAESQADTLLQTINDDPVSPRVLNPRVPRDLETICLKCLEKEPHRRYATAELLADDLRCSLRGEPILARPIGRVARMWRWCRRKPVLAGMSVALLACVLTLVVGLWISNVRVGNALQERTGAFTKLQRQQHVTEQALRDKDQALLAKEKALREEGVALAAKVRALQDRDAANARLQSSLKTQQWLTYLRGIQLAQRDYDAGYIGRAGVLLDECGPEEYRGFEWRYLRALCRQAVQWTWRGRIPIQCLSLRGTAVAYVDGGLRLFDADTGKGAKISLGRFVGSSRLSPDGRLLAYVPRRKTQGRCEIHVLDVPRGHRRVIATDSLSITPNFYFSGDGRRIAAVDRKPGAESCRFQVWDVDTGRRKSVCESALFQATFRREERSVLGAGPNLRYLVTHRGLVDTKTSREVIRFRRPLRCFAFNSDGTLLAGSDGKGTVTILDVRTATVRNLWNARAGRIESLAFSPDGTRLAGGTQNGIVAVCDASTGERRFAIETGEQADEIAFTPDGRQIMTVHRENQVQGVIRVWKDPSPQTLVIRGATTKHRVWGRKPAFSPDGRLVAAIGAHDEILICNSQSGAVVRRIAGRRTIGSVAFSPDGKQIASAGNNRYDVWNASNGELLRTLRPSKGLYCIRCEFSPDGHLLVGAHNGGATVWNWRTGRRRTFLPSPRRDCPIACFSADGKSLYVVAKSGVGTVADVSGWKERRRIRGSRAFQGELTPDGSRLVTIGGGREIALVDAKTGARIPPIPLPARPLALDVSPDGRRIAVAVGREIAILDLHTGQRLLTLAGHQGLLFGVKFAPDGQRVASMGADGTIRIWGAPPKQLLAANERPPRAPVVAPKPR